MGKSKKNKSKNTTEASGAPEASGASGAPEASGAPAPEANVNEVLTNQYSDLMDLCTGLKNKLETMEKSNQAAVKEEKIKILILSTFKHGKEKFDLKHIRTQYQILAYQLDKYIKIHGQNKFTIMHQSLPIRGTSTRIQRLPEHRKFDCVEVDFIIMCDNRGLHYRPAAFTEKIRSRARKGIFTFASNNAMVGGEDVLFYMVPNGKKNKRHCKYIGWTCDDSLCTPKQVKGRIQILIDHNYYGRHQNMLKNDLTEDITYQVCEFAKNHKEHQVIVRRFIAGGVETVDINNPQKMSKYVQGSGLSYEEACAEYCKTDIFIVTHKECMGLSVLESAMSGALVLTPEEYIKDDLLKHVHHLPFKTSINWNEAIENLNIQKSRKRVIKFNINNFVKKILVVMSRMDYLRETNFQFKNSHN